MESALVAAILLTPAPILPASPVVPAEVITSLKRAKINYESDLKFHENAYSVAVSQGNHVTMHLRASAIRRTKSFLLGLDQLLQSIP